MSDRDRALAARGRKDAQRLGTYLVHHSLIPDRALVSPAQRTRETWVCLRDRFAAASDAPPPAEFDDRLYNATGRSILGALMGAEAPARTLLVIGHNPGLYEIARQLIATGDMEPREQLNEGLPTAGLAVIDFAGDDWRKLHPQGGRLDRFITPRLLKAATD